MLENQFMLFAHGKLNDHLQRQTEAALREVPLIAAEEIRFSAEAVISRLEEQYKAQTVEVHFEQMTRSEIQELRTGQGIYVYIPFTGSAEVLRGSATTYRTSNCLGEAKPDHIELAVGSIGGLTVEIIDRRIDDLRRELAVRLAWGNQDVLNWQTQFQARIRQAVNQRKERLEQAAAVSAALEIPMRRVPDADRPAIPVTRRTVRVEPGPAIAGSKDFHLADAMYEEIIRTISGMGRTLERLPRSVNLIGEEGMRDFILVMLNATFEGAARGEVFNGNGKTDILIGWKDRNVFIGECKEWYGPKKFSEAIDQLLGYAAWRDTKAAVILFIRQGNATEIIRKAHAAIVGHPRFRLERESADAEARRDYLMTSLHDEERIIKVAFLPIVILPPPT